jgi:hypothetical protein
LILYSGYSDTRNFRRSYTPATAPGSPDPAVTVAATEMAPIAAMRCAISTCAAHPRSDTFCIFFVSKSVRYYCIVNMLCVRKKSYKICCSPCLLVMSDNMWFNKKRRSTGQIQASFIRPLIYRLHVQCTHYVSEQVQCCKEVK